MRRPSQLRTNRVWLWKKRSACIGNPASDVCRGLDGPPFRLQLRERGSDGARQFGIEREHLPHRSLLGEVHQNTVEHTARMATEFGELLATIGARLRDGQVSDNDMRAIDREAGELIAVVHATLQHLQARNEAERPVHARLAAV